MSEVLEYYHYYGSVLLARKMTSYMGKLLGIRDMVLYDGEDVKTLRHNFRDAVDGSLAFCEEEGKEPNVPFKGTFNVRVTPDLHSRVATLRSATKRS